MEVDDDLNWELGTAYLKYRRYRSAFYDATGSNFGKIEVIYNKETLDFEQFNQLTA